MPHTQQTPQRKKVELQAQLRAAIAKRNQQAAGGSSSSSSPITGTATTAAVAASGGGSAAGALAAAVVGDDDTESENEEDVHSMPGSSRTQQRALALQPAASLSVSLDTILMLALQAIAMVDQQARFASIVVDSWVSISPLCTSDQRKQCVCASDYSDANCSDELCTCLLCIGNRCLRLQLQCLSG
jgi:hypothetical protein